MSVNIRVAKCISFPTVEICILVLENNHDLLTIFDAFYPVMRSPEIYILYHQKRWKCTLSIMMIASYSKD